MALAHFSARTSAGTPLQGAASPGRVGAPSGIDEELIRQLVGNGYALTGDTMVLLVNAREGAQTRTLFDARIAQRAGVRRLIVAVDRMERVGYEYVIFKDVEARLLALAGSFSITDVRCIPVSTARGDMVAERGHAIDWYDGPTLLEAIEQ
ncbi:MAG: hypothetical protein ACKVQU_20685 [Burkholderiales bacterium]